MRMTFQIVTFIILIIFCTELRAQKPNPQGINITGNPVQITGINGTYAVENNYAGVNCIVKFKNTSDKKIIAIDFEVLCYSVFDEYIGKARGAGFKTVKPNEESKLEWFSANLTSDIYLLYTPIFYLRSVRFEDESVWRANFEDTENAIKKSNPNLDLSPLKKIFNYDYQYK